MNRSFVLSAVVLAAVLFSISPSSLTQPQDTSNSSALGEPGSVKPIDVNMHDFMEGVFQAPYKRLKLAIAQAPADNAAWKALRSDALILAEGGNLLLGRLPERDVADWIKHSELSRDVGGELVAAAKKKDYATARAAYEKMLVHCNDCHKQFEQGKHILAP